MMTIIWVGYSIVMKNILSKDIVFSFTALAAAFLMFVLNIAFSLKEEHSQYIIQPHIIITDDDIIDILSHQITKPSFLIFNRDEISKTINIKKLKENLYTTGSNRNSDYKNQLIDFLKICTIGQIVNSYPDWQEQRQTFKYSQSASFNNTKEGAGDNSFISIDQLNNILNIRDFTLNDMVDFTNGLTLPPGTRISSNKDSIIIDNPFTTINIHFEIENGFNKATPIYKNNTMMFVFTDTKSDVVNIQSNIVIDVSMKKQRSGNPDNVKYSKWAQELYKKLHNGFDLLSDS